MTSIWANVRRTVWLCLLAMATAIGSGVWITLRVAHPLRQLGQAAQTYGTKGNLLPVSPSNVREVDALQAAFEDMMQKLEENQAELAIAAQNQELERFFSAALDLLCIADIDGHFRRLNRQWETTLGYSLQDLEGARFLDLVHPDDVESTLAQIKHLAQQKTVHSFVNRYRCRDSTYRWIEWRSVPIGSLIYAAARDITQRQQMETDLRRLNERLQELATVDSLTQVANRRQMQLHLLQEWERCQRAKQPITLILLDIDYFKRYNDHYGHPQGDDCLRQVAGILRSCVNRPGDLVSRYGGEEFLIVLPETGQPGATHLMERIRQSLAQAQIPHRASLTDDKITISAGIAVITNVANFANPAAAIAEVDRLLYQAKQTRNTYCLRVI